MRGFILKDNKDDNIIIMIGKMIRLRVENIMLRYKIIKLEKKREKLIKQILMLRGEDVR